MKMGFELNMQQSQKLVMTPELQQAIAILQLPTQELIEYVEEQLVENPVLELKDDSNELENSASDEKEDSPQEEKFDIDWQNYFQDESDLGYTRHSKEKKESVAYENFISEAPTLHEHLMMQYNLIANDQDKEIGEFIIGNLDDNGYLCTSVDDILNHLKIKRKKAEEVLKIVQNLEPAGVGARNLKECLLLQLKSKGIDDDIVRCLIENHLHDLGDGRINKIAKKISLNVHEVQQIVDLIKTLDPKPGRWFASGGDVRYIVPDVVVEKVDGEYVVTINDVYAPKLGINPVYRALMKKNSKCDSNTKNFIEGKLNSACWIIKSIEQRRVTLYKVVSCIVDYQSDFLDYGIKHLKTLNLKRIADEVDLHESTVSRAISGKFIQTPKGVYQLKFFFASGVNNLSGSSTSSNSIKKLLREYISEENKKKPYTDQQLTNMLKSQGIKISRRTVAKYRVEMDIESTNKRRRY